MLFKHMNTDNHQMYLTSESGNNETYECPTCHRTIIVQWTPFRRIVVEYGDDDANHFATKGVGIDINLNNKNGSDEDRIISDELAELLDELDFLN